jgi:hypothetical protein
MLALLTAAAALDRALSEQPPTRSDRRPLQSGRRGVVTSASHAGAGNPRVGAEWYRAAWARAHFPRLLSHLLGMSRRN